MGIGVYEKEEIWKPIKLPIRCTNQTRYEVSNKGRVRSFNHLHEGKILKCGLVEGYHSLNLKLFKHRTAKDQAKVDALKEEILTLKSKRTVLIEQMNNILGINALSEEIEAKEATLSKFLADNLKKRTKHVHLLVHRLVAMYFLPPPSTDQTLVSHLDYNKINNDVDNLKWMTKEENNIHRNKSPFVIEEKKKRKIANKNNRGGYFKLTKTQVIRIKKLLKRGWTLRRIAKEFGVSDMQVSRIKNGENWGHVKIDD